MKCPDCNSELKQIDCKGIMIDECVGCKGKWFDRGELRKAKDSADKEQTGSSLALTPPQPLSHLKSAVSSKP